MLSKLINLQVATMCAMGGDATGIGFIFALCHDYSTITAEAKVNLMAEGQPPITRAFHTIVSELLPI